MDNLDEFMRKKFTERDEAAPFEFREAYWQAAQELIRADREKRRKRVFWWWFSGFLAVLLFSCLCLQSEQFATYFPKNRTSESQNIATKTSPSNDVSRAASTTIDSKENTAKQSKKTEQNLSIEKNEGTKIQTERSFLQKNTAKRSARAAENSISQPSSKLYTKSAQKTTPQVQSTEKPMRVVVSSTETTDQTLSTDDNTPNQSSKLSDPIAFVGASSAAKNPTTKQDASISLALKIQESKEYVTDFLPTYLLYVDELMNIPEITLELPALSALTKPHKQKSTSWGIQSVAALYDNATVLENPLFGGGGGLYFTYVGRKKWGLRTALNVVHLTGNDLLGEVPQQSQATTYSFGFETELKELQPTSMQSAEVELGLLRQLRSGNLYAGLFAGHTFNMRADFSQQNRNSLDTQLRPSTTKPTNINPLATPTLYSGAVLGYDYRLLSKFDIGLGLRYSPNGFFKQGVDNMRSTPRNIFGATARIAYRF